jgi:membrane protease YdiL (CAAX protease family)
MGSGAEGRRPHVVPRILDKKVSAGLVLRAGLRTLVVARYPVRSRPRPPTHRGLRSFPRRARRAGDHPRQDRSGNVAAPDGAVASWAEMVAVALLLPVAIALAAAVFNVLLGAQAPSAVELGGWTRLFSTFFILLLIPGLGGTWEEPGWRGYALPRLQVGLSALLASLILGVLWAFWHLPLMVVGEVPWSDIVFVIAWTVVFTWLFNNSRGSVLLAMLMHAMNNTISGSFFGPMFSGADSVRQGWFYAALWCAVAVVLIVVYGPQHLSRTHHKQEEDPVQPEGSTASPRVV